MPYEAEISQAATSSSQMTPYGISKHTSDTMDRLQTTFDQKNQAGEAPKVSYQQLAGQEIKRADAVKLFFDVLVLSTKNMVKVKQAKPYGEIAISQAVMA